MSEGWQQKQQRQQEGGDYDDDDASRMFMCEEEEESSGGGMGFPCSSSPSSAATVEVAENAASIVSCTSSTPAAGGISSSELDAWIRDEPMDCMMLLPDIQLDGGTAHDSMPQVSQDDEQLHQPPLSDEVDVATKPGYPMFCRSSSSCSSTFPESDNQECMELSIPEDFLDDKQQGLPPLTEERGSQRSPFPDLKKIIVKKPVMDKAVERLGGGRKGAIRLWNIIQVWLKHQQASGDGQQSPVDGILQNVGFLGGMQLPFGEEILGDGNAQCETGRGGNSVVGDGDNPLYGNPFGGCQEAMLAASGAHAQYASFVDPTSPSANSQQKHMGAQLGGHFYTYAGLRTVVDRDGSCTGLADCGRGPMSPAATTRAARKSRMARQRRHTGRVGGPSPPASWTSLVPSSPADTGARQAAREQQQHVNPCLPSYTCRDGKGRGCEKSVKFLLQKELKPSDVGNLGRIVLPKKEAEVHLPYLTLREGITMAMEDMLTTHTWHFRYRFWPNNKSRMYLLEGTGEFVKSHCLKEGDVLQIYRDCKYGKHMIYGKKIVRPEMTARAQAAAKLEDDNVSGVSSISDSSKDAEHSGTRTCTVSSSQAGTSAAVEGSKLDSDGLDGFPSLELGDEFIEEIMGLVDAPEEPSSPESGKEDS